MLCCVNMKIILLNVAQIILVVTKSIFSEPFRMCVLPNYRIVAMSKVTLLHWRLKMLAHNHFVFSCSTRKFVYYNSLFENILPTIAQAIQLAM